MVECLTRDSSRGCGFEPHRHHCVVSLSKTHLSLLSTGSTQEDSVLDLRQRGHGFEPHQRHCIVSLSKNINPCLVLVQPRKTRPHIAERLLTGT